MRKPTETRFSVSADNEAAAVAHLIAAGFPPLRIEHDDGCSVLVFAPLPDDQMLGLVKALPVHLSAKIGIVGSSFFE